jgi:iron complex transport system ATP-binding protein
MMNAVEIKNLSVSVGSKKLVSDVSLNVEAGSWLTIIGPNGAGKTTLIEAVAGIRKFGPGSVKISGQDMAQLNERDRARLVAFVPQNPLVPAGMSVLDYVTLGRTSYHGMLRAPTAGDRAIVDSVLERLSLQQFAKQNISVLSGGERQRTVIARALAQSTMVVVLDEPITGLDLRHQMELLELLKKEVAECGLTVLATLHDLTLAGQFADRLVLLDKSEVVLDGPAHDIIRNPELASRYGMQFRVVDVDGSDVVVPVRS